MIVEDMDFAQYQELFSSSDVCLAPSRWEGLGLHLFEAIECGIPVVTNDIPPMNELIRHGFNGLLVKSHQIGNTRCGLPSYDPDIEDLARAIEALSDRELVNQMSRNTLVTRESMKWENVCADWERLLTLPSNARGWLDWLVKRL